MHIFKINCILNNNKLFLHEAVLFHSIMGGFMLKKTVAVFLFLWFISLTTAQNIDDFDFSVTDIHDQEHNLADYLRTNHWILVDITKNN